MSAFPYLPSQITGFIKEGKLITLLLGQTENSHMSLAVNVEPERTGHAT